MATDSAELLAEEYEDVEYIDEDGEMVDEEEDDPDFTPGDAELDEDEDEDLSLEDEGDGSAMERISDTNAPYADAADGVPESARRRGGGGMQLPNPLKLLGQLRPARLAAAMRGQGKRVQRLVWRAEDAAVTAVKLARRLAIKGARPALVWLIVARALRTIDRADDLGLRMLRQPAAEQMDYYYRNLLGDDWQQQAAQDLVDAVADVDAGYLTDDMVRERRGLQAAILRRLEVEEWDKERMRHFYYGLYGMGPWYWDMEERLHNPFFIGARGWNGPPESWIGENQTFPADMAPGARDARMAIAEQLGAARGEPLSRRVLQRLLDAETVAGVDQVAASKLLRGVMSPEQLRERVAARQLQQQQQKQTHVPVALA